MVVESRQNEVIRLFKEDLEEKEIRQLFKKIGFSSKHQLVVVLVKLFGDVEAKEISSIIDNITSNKIMQAQVEEDLLVILYQPIEEEKVELANFLVDAVETELFGKIKIGISSPKYLQEVKLAYAEGMEALNIGIEYHLPGSTYFYSDLLEYRVLSNLPYRIVEKFHKELLSLGIDKLSKEELKTASIFIDSNLNISEAARRLYVHRNTLNYRLDKIQKDTGFDLRTFKDAFDFKIFLTIYQYVKNKGK